MTGAAPGRAVIPRDALKCYRATMEESLLPMAATEGTSHVVRYVNPAFCRLSGRPRDELMGRTFAEIAPAFAAPDTEALLDKVYRTGEAESMGTMGPPDSDGASWSCTAWAILDEKDRPLGVTIQATDTSEAERMRRHWDDTTHEMRDISQQLLLSSIRKSELAEQAAAVEQELLQARKMEAIGRLAGGVAHDFNNLLTVILGNIDLAEDSQLPGPDGRGPLQEIKEAAERAAALTGQLLSFARKQICDPKVLDLNELVAGIDSILQRLIGPPVHLAFRPEASLGRVKLDSGQFGQVLMNLVVNARDAMPDGGHIAIETANITLDERTARTRPEVVPGDYVLVSVSDDGMGMTDEVKAHLFEPFFTTKEQGKGTGLGLATCYGVVRQAGGHVVVTSSPGQGTRIEILLPRVHEPDALAAPASPVTPTRGTETILLVEDEPMVRDVAARVLRRQGYTVFESEDGQAALDFMLARGGNIDLVLTDVMMPRMGGKELVQHLHATDPHLRVLYTSGYAADAGTRQNMVEDGSWFLQKPYSPTELARKVRALLDMPRRHLQAPHGE